MIIKYPYPSTYKTSDFDNYAEYLKSTQGITMRYQFDYATQFWSVRMSKGNYNMEVKISSYEVEQDHHFMILKKAAVDLNTYIVNMLIPPQTADDFNKYIVNNLIPPQAIEMTQHTDTIFNMEKINIMKQAAKLVLKETPIKGILAGGCFTSWYHQEVPRDFDIFVTNYYQKTALYSMTHNQKGRYTSTDLSYLKSNSNIEAVFLDTQTKIQYIIMKHNTRKQVIAEFDAEHAAVSYEDDNLYISPSTYECIKNKIIRPHGSNQIQPWRIQKFLKKGFKHEAVSI